MERRDKLDSININDLFRSELNPIPQNTDNKKQKWKTQKLLGGWGQENGGGVLGEDLPCFSCLKIVPVLSIGLVIHLG